MFLERDGERLLLADALHYFHVIDVQFVSAGSPLVRSHRTRDQYARFLGKSTHPFEHFCCDGRFGHDALHGTRSIAEDGKQ